jgi:hypothetical protein
MVVHHDNILMNKYFLKYLEKEFDKKDKKSNIIHRRYVYTYEYLNDELYDIHISYEKKYITKENIQINENNTYFCDDNGKLTLVTIKKDADDKEYCMIPIKKEYFVVEIAAFYNLSDYNLETYKILKDDLEKIMREEKLKNILKK